MMLIRNENVSRGTLSEKFMSAVSFDEALKFVLANEGSFVDDAQDPGGATNYGISLRFLQSLDISKLRSYGIWDHEITKQTIEDLTPEQVSKIYKGEFWLDIYEKINNQLVANYIFDMAVNHGPAMAHKIVQRASWAVIRNRDIIDDGIFGDHTLGFVNSGFGFIPALLAERAGYFRTLVAIRAESKKYLEGWLNRAYRIS